MKKLLQIIVILGVFAIAFHFRFELNQKFAPYINSAKDKLGFGAINPCLEPLPYALGDFDTRFGISKTYFLSALTEAEAMWEKPYGKNLFDFTETDTGSDVLKVNLVYDYRQQATTKLNSLGIQVEDTRASYEELKAKLDTLKAQYDRDKAAFNARVAAFNKKQQAYESDVNYWNTRGGAPKNEFDKLQAREAELKAESKRIQTAQNNLNNRVDEINALVVAVNRLIGVLNLSVDKYNTTSEARGESFEEGVYTTDGYTSEIDIYEFSNRDKLVRVLAHELGHALGLDHVDDEDAIMYRLNQSDSLVLAEADLAALKSKCSM